MKTALAAAQQSSFLDTAALPIIIVVIAIIAILAILASGYVKAPPDQAYIISGLKKESKILIGRAGIKIPFLERMDKLYLGQMTVDIKTEQSVPTNDFINVNVDAVAKVRINPTTDGIKLAAKNFLNKKPGDIALDLQDSLQGNMREIIGTLSLKVINTDRDSFSDQVMMKASKDMDKLGIEILSCNIQNVTDENGLIKDLGADNTSLIKKNAAIAKAQADRDIAIAQAEADKAANEARVLSDTQIAQKNNELEIRRAELKIISDNKKAEADAAYKIQAQSQQKSIETETVNAQIARQRLDAEIRAKADADRYREEQQAQAELFKRQKEAEAKKFEQQQDAEAKKAMAEAVRFAREQEAEGIRATGLAEAEAIRAKATAEAEGIDKKAEAMKKYGEAAIIEMIMQALPEIAKNVAEPLSKVDKITMYGEGNSAKMLQDIINSTTQVTEGLAQGMGIDVKALLSSIVGAKIASNTPEDPQKSDSDEYEQ
ncbi:SPFH domain-containing protein [Anthropogastromicrobium sp.]|uniref:flotillin family protein n=1 Tax=Anthropogastromicrobium sp. TaxID=2981649 RepID=UPI00307CA0F3